MTCSFWLLKLFESVHRHLKVRRPGLTIRQENQKVNGVVNGQNAPDSSDVKRDEICFGSCHLVLGGQHGQHGQHAACQHVQWMSTSGEKQQDATGCYRITMEYTGLQWITNHCSISFEAVISQHSVGIGSPFLDAAIGHPIHFNLFQR